MTLQALEDELKAVCADTYQLAAPSGLTRYVVYHTYGAEGLNAEDSTRLSIPRVQIDVFWQDLLDTLPEDVMDVLEDSHLPYEMSSCGYDDQFAALRCILSLELI